MPDVSGLYVLGGASLAEAARWLHDRRSRTHVLTDRAHAETRADLERWRLERREVHAAFLAAGAAWHEALLRARNKVQPTATYGEDLDREEDAVGPALARLELIADDASKAGATAWTRKLSEAASGLSIHNIDPSDDLGRRMLIEHLEEARTARFHYIEAARLELGTTSGMR